jgi:hypothetical protein
MRRVTDMAVADIADEALAQLYIETGVDLSQLPPIMTAAELAPALKTTVMSLANERYRRVGVPYVKHGRRVRYLRADVARYLLANRRGETA